jgi:Fe-S-cluster-containing dehydrogenase component
LFDLPQVGGFSAVSEREKNLPPAQPAQVAQWRSLNPAPRDPNALMPAQMEDVNRREFLSLMAASLVLAGVSGCSPAAKLPERIVPYVRPPEEVLPGIPLYFATAMPFAGYGIGLIVKSNEGRPTKIEGNPRHPASVGSTDVFAQASILDLYDPDRAKSVTRHGAVATIDSFVTAVSSQLDKWKASGGTGLRFLSGTVTSPSEIALFQEILKKFPNARWYQYEAVNNDNARAGARIAFGRYLDAIYHFDRADIVVSLDSDFLYWGPAHVRYTRDFSGRRAAAASGNTMNRLYAFESSPGITGAKADHRIAMRPAEITRLALAMASRLGIPEAGKSTLRDDWFDPMIRDIESQPGTSIVIAGPSQPPFIHALAHAINEKLGNIGKTVVYTEPPDAQTATLAAEQTASLRELVEEMQSGTVETLVMLETNPVYSAPADLEFPKHLSRVPLRISHSLFYDETAAACDWHIPQHHFLEMWGDVRAYDGTISIIQPLIVPLYQTKSPHEFLSIFLEDPSRSNYELVRDFWQHQHPDDDFEDYWANCLQQGIVPDSQVMPVRPSVRLQQTALSPDSAASTSQAESPDQIDVLFRPDPSMYDGSFANNVWLLELPRPLTRLTWDNAVMLSPKTAAKLHLGDEDLVDVVCGGRQVTGAVWVVPGHSNDCATLHLGWGRTQAGTHGTHRGFNSYAVQTSADLWHARGQIRKRGGKYKLVSTQKHHETEGRHMVRHMAVSDYVTSPRAIQEETHIPSWDETMYPQYGAVDYAWGMSVDLSRCVGCNACVIACQSENNIPVVGKEEVARSREMHWMRIDAYYEGAAENPDAYFQPMFCQHCETAPCELVCPVEATTHSTEGLNEMTYNRCIGTRYCSNNCPYKVRRFNFFQYAEWDIPSLKLLYNPDVTVRSRGVMEKCTYCVQRINRTRIESLKEDRSIRDGELMTACQQACPATALTFGNLLDKDSKVAKLKSEPRNYAVLSDYNTRPRTTYLAVLKNPNPEIQGPQTARDGNG